MMCNVTEYGVTNNLKPDKTWALQLQVIMYLLQMTYILVENVKNWQVLCKLFLISKCSANLRRQLYRKEIRLQQRAQTIHANYDQHRPITWGKPQELFQFVKTSEYLQLENINSEACEQTNLALRRITRSTTFMSPSMSMRSLTLFMADINITANKFKEKYFQSQSWKNDRKYCTILFYYMRMN